MNDKQPSSGTRGKNTSKHLQVSPVKQLLASLPVSGQSLAICQDHPVMLMNGPAMWNKAGEKMLCKNFSHIGNVKRSLRLESFL